jgi:hypothetical protein
MFTSSFLPHRAQKCKKTVKLSVFLALLVSVHVKAAFKMLVKLSPVVNVIDILCKFLFAKKLQSQILIRERKAAQITFVR